MRSSQYSKRWPTSVALGVDGIWGGETQNTILEFKGVLDIRTDDGVLDGLVGPKTMAALDFIFGTGLLDVLAQQMAFGSPGPGNRVGEPQQLESDVVAAVFDQGTVVMRGWIRAVLVRPSTVTAWTAAGSTQGVWGAPLDNPRQLDDGSFAQAFDGGIAVERAVDGQVILVPDDVWETIAGTAGTPLPTGTISPGPTGDTQVHAVDGGAGVVRSSSGAPVLLPAAVLDLWTIDAAELGEPTGAVSFDDDGPLFGFVGGAIQLNVNSGAVRAPIPSLNTKYFLPAAPTVGLGAPSDGTEAIPIAGGLEFRSFVDNDLGQVQSPSDFVYLLGWNCELDFDLGGGFTLGQRLVSAKTAGAQVCAMLWAANPITQAAGPVLHALPLAALVLDEIELAIIPPRAHNLVAASQINGFGSPSSAILDERYLFAGSHHQKVLIIGTANDLVAYVGGIEFSADRLTDSPNGKPFAGAPLLDTSVRLRGPGAQQLLSTFIERWSAHPQGAGVKLVGASRATSAPAGFGPVRTQIGHTYGRGAPFAQGRRTAGQLEINALAKPTKFFYMEDQYFVGNELLGHAISGALTGDVIGIIVIAAEDSVSDLPDLPFRRREFLRPLVNASAGKLLVFESVGTNNTSTGKNAYVHSKLLIVDDEVVVIGSMNAMRRSWSHDSEVMASLVDFHGADGSGPGDRGLARKLRCLLWGRHLGPFAGSPVAAPTLDDPVTSIALWQAITLTSGNAVRPYDATATVPRKTVKSPITGKVLSVPAALLNYIWDTVEDPVGP